MTTACILGISGKTFSPEERKLFSEAQPWGMILFARNIETPEQVRALTSEFRSIAGRDDAAVLVDQEGGRVQRLKPPHWQIYPPASAFAEIYRNDKMKGLEAVGLGAALIANDLTDVGINVDCLPVADLRLPEAHDIIGDRAYGKTPDQVATLARAAAEALMQSGVLPVLKHIPGHGRAKTDSHEELPVVDASVDELAETDFETFWLLNDLPLGMTAHVVYSAIDADNAATVSPTVIADVVRGHIGFDGLLMSDDLSMKALKGSLRTRAEAAIGAGCDVNLHCNGEMGEMREVLAGSPQLAGDALDRASAALGLLKRPLESFDVAEARARFSAMMGVA
jgi:beta-N-acetylhexosaminidase